MCKMVALAKSRPPPGSDSSIVHASIEFTQRSHPMKTLRIALSLIAALGLSAAACGKKDKDKTEPAPKVEPQAEQPKVDPPKVEEPKIEEPKAEDPKAVDPKAEEPKAEEPKAEEPKAADPKAADPKAEPAPAPAK